MIIDYIALDNHLRNRIVSPGSSCWLNVNLTLKKKGREKQPCDFNGNLGGAGNLVQRTANLLPNPRMYRCLPEKGLYQSKLSLDQMHV
ncbi:hypothetical protein Y1Q_0011267 [Alligator mississippiensis]|uniref:Uncharacterized protein n=1 Tax=Alligator mississippiensis TaxID=8496 RepID=A0A151N7Y9_ALLMI|nr:hypothetical protein Y1Q_0011267 [Alligator mississippiensis]